MTRKYPELSALAVCSALVALLTAERLDSREMMQLKLLHDVRVVFGKRKTMSTKMLLAKLWDMDEAPWPKYYGSPLNENDLANLLRPYSVKPMTVRVKLNGGVTKVAKGYKREHLGTEGRELHDLVRCPYAPRDSRRTPVAVVQQRTQALVSLGAAMVENGVHLIEQERWHLCLYLAIHHGLRRRDRRPRARDDKLKRFEKARLAALLFWARHREVRRLVEHADAVRVDHPQSGHEQLLGRHHDVHPYEADHLQHERIGRAPRTHAAYP